MYTRVLGGTKEGEEMVGLVEFEEVFERWGSEYVITTGQHKGYRLSVKTIVERIYPLSEVDDVGLPKFKVSHHTVIRVLPKDETKK